MAEVLGIDIEADGSTAPHRDSISTTQAAMKMALILRMRARPGPTAGANAMLPKGD